MSVLTDDNTALLLCVTFVFCDPSTTEVTQPPAASVESGLCVSGLGDPFAPTTRFPHSSCNSETRPLEECMAILSDPQVSSQRRLKSLQKTSLVLYLSEWLRNDWSALVAFSEGGPFSQQ